jgi:hypothetical protein
MQDFYVVAYAIENLVRVTDDKQHSHTEIVRLITNERMVFQLATASLMLAATFVAPLGDRSLKYSSMRSRSENAAGV